MSDKLCPGCPGDPNETCCKPELRVQLWREHQAAQLATPAQDAVCNDGDCAWGGPLSQCRMLGAIGPLCPNCGETVELCGVPQQATPEPGDDAQIRAIGEGLRSAHDHIEMHRLERRHCKDAERIREGLAAFSAYKKRGDFAATPEPVGEPAHIEVVGEIVATEDGNDVQWSIEGGADAIPEGMVLLIADRQITDETGSGEVYTRPAPGVPDVKPNEMENKWCWWLGDDESFHVVENESEAHGEAQSRIDDDCAPGQTHQYSVARVQHPLDALGMDWLALNVAQSIAENVCCWCDDNTGAEEPSIMLSPDDSKALGVMVATFLRQRVGVDWWTADQKTITVHTYVSGSNNDPTLAAAQAKEANPEDLAAAGVRLMGRRDE